MCDIKVFNVFIDSRSRACRANTIFFVSCSKPRTRIQFISFSGPVYVSPPGLSCRLLISVWWLCVLVMISVYTGSLMAQLTVTRLTLPFNDLQQLAEGDGADDYLLAVLDDSVIEEVLRVRN